MEKKKIKKDWRSGSWKSGENLAPVIRNKRAATIVIELTEVKIHLPISNKFQINCWSRSEILSGYVGG